MQAPQCTVNRSPRAIGSVSVWRVQLVNDRSKLVRCLSCVTPLVSSWPGLPLRAFPPRHRPRLSGASDRQRTATPSWSDPVRCACSASMLPSSSSSVSGQGRVGLAGRRPESGSANSRPDVTSAVFRSRPINMGASSVGARLAERISIGRWWPQAMPSHSGAIRSTMFRPRLVPKPHGGGCGRASSRCRASFGIPDQRSPDREPRAGGRFEFRLAVLGLVRCVASRAIGTGEGSGSTICLACPTTTRLELSKPSARRLRREPRDTEGPW